MKFWIDTLFGYKWTYSFVFILSFFTLFYCLVLLIGEIRSFFKSDADGFEKIDPDIFWVFLVFVGVAITVVIFSNDARKIYNSEWQGKVIKVYSYKSYYKTRNGRKYNTHYAVELENHDSHDVPDIWKKVKKGDFVFKEKGSYKVKIRGK